MGKYLNLLYYKLLNVYKYTVSVIGTIHDNAKVGGWYKLLGFELFNVFVTGLLISIALVAFGYDWKPWLSLSYGLVPWLLIQFLVYGKKQLRQ